MFYENQGLLIEQALLIIVFDCKIGFCFVLNKAITVKYHSLSSPRT